MVPKNKRLLILKVKHETAGSPEVASRTLIFSHNKTDKNFKHLKVGFVYAILGLTK